ncbi:MAG: WG repeat-containing protein [bacterium]
MRKYILLIVTLIIALTTLNAQNNDNEPLGAYKLDGKWHVFDYKGNMMFEPLDLIQIGGYGQGLILTIKEIDGQKKWAYYDTKGNLKFSFVADNAKVFSDSTAMIRYCVSETCDTVKYAYIDHSGKQIVAPNWYDATVFVDGLAWVMNFDERGFINKKGEFVIKADKGVFGLPFVEGLAVVHNKDAKFGFMNKKGEMQIPFQYDDALSFSDSLAPVYIAGRFLFIDYNGKTVIKTNRQFARGFKNGYAFTALPNSKFKPLWQVINRQGVLMTQETFATVTDFSQGLAAVQKMDGKWIFIDPYGQNILEKEYDFATPFHKGLAWASIRAEKKFGFINPNGEWVVQLPVAEGYVDFRVNQIVK